MSAIASGVAPLSLGTLLATALIIAAWPLLPGPWRLALAVAGPSLSLLFAMGLWAALNYLDGRELTPQMPGSDAGVDG